MAKKIKVEATIDKGVPIPVTYSRYPLLEMDVGDSFTIPAKKRGSVASRANALAAKTGRKWITRTVSEDEVRVWRTK